MGMLLDDPHGVTKLDSYTYYETQLKNDKILLNQIDRAIAALSASDGIQGLASCRLCRRRSASGSL